MTMELVKPLTVEEINTKYEEAHAHMLKSYSRMRKLGLAFIFIGVCIYFLLDAQTLDKEIFKHISGATFLSFGLCILALPSILKGHGAGELYTFDYVEASKERIYNCEAYIQTPKMEKMKAYVEDVKSQGRKLTNYECSVIIQQWDLVVKESA